MNSHITLDEIDQKVSKLETIDDLDEKLEVIKIVKENIIDYQKKIHKYKIDIENENNYIIYDIYKNLSFQELKKIFEDSAIDIDNKLKIYQTYSKKLIQLEDELFETL